MVKGKSRDVWSREELVVVLDLYFRLPSGKFTDSEPSVIEVAELIGRTPGAVAMRLANYLALDERSGAEGLSHSGDHARRVWEEFRDTPAAITLAAGDAKVKLLEAKRIPPPQP
jgi:putative restriction endonuclease